MLALLLESALRSLLLGAAVWLGLKFLRVKNPHAQMTAWTLVLVASLAMPALMRVVTVTIPDAPPAPLAQIIWRAPAASPLPDAAPQPALSAIGAQAAPVDEIVSQPVVAAARVNVDWRAAATAVYLAVTGMLLLRLLIGLVLTWRVARASRPVRASWAAGIDVRVSEVVGVPVTFGSRGSPNSPKSSVMMRPSRRWKIDRATQASCSTSRNAGSAPRWRLPWRGLRRFGAASSGSSRHARPPLGRIGASACWWRAPSSRWRLPAR
jgi:hypothetical protein